MNDKNEILCDSKFLQLKGTKRQNGNIWVYAHRPNVSNVVTIVPIIHRANGDFILFLKTARPALIAENKCKYCLELPAGLVGDEIATETILEAAQRELLEETGMEAEKYELIASNIASSSGLTSETFSVASADIYDETIKSPSISDGGVILDRVIISIIDIYPFIRKCEQDGYTISSQLLSGIFCHFANKKI